MLTDGCKKRKVKTMTIAFDIDGTISLDPDTFYRVIREFRMAGWTTIIVTGAEQPPEKLKRLKIDSDDLPIIVSAGMFKEQSARKAGYKVDVWVDDMPGVIQETLILKDGVDSEL